MLTDGFCFFRTTDMTWEALELELGNDTVFRIKMSLFQCIISNVVAFSLPVVCASRYIPRLAKLSCFIPGYI